MTKSNNNNEKLINPRDNVCANYFSVVLFLNIKTIISSRSSLEPPIVWNNKWITTRGLNKLFVLVQFYLSDINWSQLNFSKYANFIYHSFKFFVQCNIILFIEDGATFVINHTKYNVRIINIKLILIWGAKRYLWPFSRIYN